MQIKIIYGQSFSKVLAFWIFSALFFQITIFAQTRGVRVKVKDETTNATEEVELYKGSYALVIGAVNYNPKAGWKKLNGVREDVPAVVKVLENNQKFDVVETLIDPTSENLLQKMTTFVNNYGLNPENRILIYYAGHGYTETESDNRKFGYLVPIDAPDPKKDFQGFIAKAVSMDDIENLAKRIRSKHALFVFDSCFSGTLINRNKIVVPPIINYLATQNVRQFITSGEAGEEVPDESIFREMFVRGLEGEADKPPFGNNDGFITASELAYFLQDRVIYYAKTPQTPQYGKIRDPKLDRGDFIFTAGSQNGKVEPIPSPKPTPFVGETKSGEEVLWEEATRLNSKVAYKIYLGEFPNGKYASTARLRIKNIEDEEKQAENNRQAEEVRQAKQAEQQKWSDASRVNTIESYQSYLNVYPNGEYKSVANLRIKDLIAKAEAEKLKNPKAGMTIKNSLGMEFMGIPAGTFMMGSPTSETDRSSDEVQHQVTISKGYWMGKYEVTQAEWKAVMGNNPSYFKNCPRCPVESVSWEEVQEFIKKLNEKGEGTYRLPTEAEWEYAARAGTTSAFGIGDGKNLSSKEANFDGNYPYGNTTKGKWLEKTIPVGSYQANAYGLYDMHGNVWEWCNDWYGEYPNSGVTDPKGPSAGSSRVNRGGGWFSDGGNLRSADRDYNSPSNRYNNLGFRLIRSN
jgi:formylglycine-generating enzyme required for sulfatase activity